MIKYWCFLWHVNGMSTRGLGKNVDMSFRLYSKRRITSGTRAQFFTVAVRTGGAGAGGISLLLMEKGMKGFEARRMKTQGWWTSRCCAIQDQTSTAVIVLINHPAQSHMLRARDACRVTRSSVRSTAFLTMEDVAVPVRASPCLALPCNNKNTV